MLFSTPQKLSCWGSWIQTPVPIAMICRQTKGVDEGLKLSLTVPILLSLSLFRHLELLVLHRGLMLGPWCLCSLPSGALPACEGTAAVPAMSKGTLHQVGDSLCWVWTWLCSFSQCFPILAALGASRCLKSLRCQPVPAPGGAPALV